MTTFLLITNVKDIVLKESHNSFYYFALNFMFACAEMIILIDIYDRLFVQGRKG
jgi:hypothetical protein